MMRVPVIISAERRGKMKLALRGASALILIGQLLLGKVPHTILSVAAIVLVTKVEPGTRKGAAAG